MDSDEIRHSHDNLKGVAPLSTKTRPQFGRNSRIRDNLGKHPANRDTLLALVTFYRDAGNVGTALEYAQQLAKIAPDDRAIAGLVEALKRQLESSSR